MNRHSAQHMFPVLAYRLQGECYNCQYISTCTCSGCVSVHCWGWISHEGAGMLHHIDQLDGLQYKHILQNVRVHFVRKLYYDGIIQFQQDNSSIHDSRVV